MPNVIVGMPLAGFHYVKGAPKSFTRSDISDPVTREFCPECGTQILARTPTFPAIMLKVGTMDDPASYGAPQMAIFTIDKQVFHHVPDGVPAFERRPG